MIHYKKTLSLVVWSESYPNTSCCNKQSPGPREVGFCFMFYIFVCV